LLRFLFSCILIFLILKTINLNKIIEIISGIEAPYLVAGFFTVLLGAFPSAYAWKMLMDVQKFRISFLRIVYMNLVGFFFNSFLPTGVGGDVWRGYTLSRVSEKTGKSVASVIMERFVAFGSIVLLGLISFLFNIDRFQKAGILQPISIFFGVITAVFIGAIIITPYLLENGKERFSRFLPFLRETDLAEALVEYKKKPGLVLSALLMTSISPLLECGTYILIIKALNLDVSFLPVFILVPILRFINHIPVSLNSLGTQDLTLLLFWKPLGLSPAEALSISFLMHILRLLVGLTGGLLYILFPYEKNGE